MKPTIRVNSDRNFPGAADAVAPETVHHDGGFIERTGTHLRVIAASPHGVETLLVFVGGDENGEATGRAKPDLARILARLQALPNYRSGCPAEHSITTTCTYPGPCASPIEMTW